MIALIWTPTLAASLDNSAAALPPRGRSSRLGAALRRSCSTSRRSQRTRDRALGQCNLERVVAIGLRTVDAGARSGVDGGGLQPPADQRALGGAHAPGFVCNAAQDDACIAHAALAHVQRSG